MQKERPAISPAQSTYARVLGVLAWIGRVFLVIAFVIYTFALLPDEVPPVVASSYWHLSADDYALATDSPPGWARLSNILTGDAVSLVSLLFLATASIFCLIAVLPVFVRNRDWPYLIFVSALIAILVVAASGVVGGPLH